MNESLLQLAGVGPAIARLLEEAGFADVEAIAAAEPSELVAVRGVGSVRAASLRVQAADLVAAGTAAAPFIGPDEDRENQARKLRRKAKRLRGEARRLTKRAESTKSKKKRKRRLRKVADLEKAARKARRKAKKLLAG
jgi:Holliday junction resolvasome RuvABC DNA-binding subunit